MTTSKSMSGGSLQPKSTARIVLVDEHMVVRQGIAELINQEPDMRVVGQAADFTTALRLVEELSPDLVILDLALKDGSGFDLIKVVRLQYPRLPILVLSVLDESVFAPSALRSGALGYVMKHQPVSTLLAAIRQTLNGKIHLSSSLRTRTLQHQIRRKGAPSDSPLELLSRREKQVFELIGQWLRPSEIARALNVSVKTVSTYREKIKEKLNLQSAAQLAQFATEWRRSTANRQPPDTNHPPDN